MTLSAQPGIVSYEAWDFPVCPLVFEMPSRRVEAEFETLQEARVHADQLNKWLAARPTPDTRYRMFVLPAEPTEAQLVALVDRMYEEPETLELDAEMVGGWPMRAPDEPRRSVA